MLRLLLAGTALALLGSAAAQVCLEEIEPNDTPADALPFREAACLTGVFEGPDQDAFMWRVDTERAGRTWTLELEGHRQGDLTRLDLMDVTFHENGVDVAAVHALGSLQTIAPRPGEAGPVILPPGDILVALSKSSGDGRWALHMHPGDAIDAGRHEVGSGSGFRGAASLWGLGEETVSVEWELEEQDSDFLWNLELLVPLGREARLLLYDSTGNLITSGSSDARGRLSLRSLGLEAGRHVVEVEFMGDGGLYQLDLVRAGRNVDGVESEPNNSFDTANVLRLDTPLQATSGDQDFFVFEVDEEAARRAWNLLVTTEDELHLTLFDEEQRELLDRRGWSGPLEDLVLAPGSYYLRTQGRREFAYELAFRPSAGMPAAGFEHEPNDTVAAASLLGEELEVRGSLSGNDTDVYEFELSGPAQLMRIQAVGEGVSRLRLLNGAGSVEQEIRGERRLRLDNVRVLPGVNYIEVQGNGGDYALRGISLGEAPTLLAAPQTAAPHTQLLSHEQAAQADLLDLGNPPAGILEVEPNDDRSRAQLLRLGETRVGTFGSERDRDFYRFYLPQPTFVRVTATAPEGARLGITLDGGPGHVRGRDADGGIAFDYLLPAGDIFLELSAVAWAAGYYSLLVESVDPLVQVDLEPNDDPGNPAQLPAGLDWTGTVGDRRDDDYYAIPPANEVRTLRVELDAADGVRAFVTDEAGRTVTADGDDPDLYELETGESYLLRLTGQGEYAVRLELDSEPPIQLLKPVGPAGPEVELASPHAEVAAYWHHGQRVPVTVRLKGDDQARQLTLYAATSSPDVLISVPEEQVELLPGDEKEIELELSLLPDLRDDQPLTITLAAISEGEINSSRLELEAVCEAKPVSWAPMWRTPEPLLGHLNLLFHSFGMTVVSPEGSAAEALFDGITSPSTGYRGPLGEPITVALPGDTAWGISGLMLDPLGRGEANDRLRGFRLELSMDGEEYWTVLEDELASGIVEESFVFAEVQEARFARLTPLSRYGGSLNLMHLGEWKLIAADPAPFGQLNIAQPELGGHVAWSSPLMRDRGRAILTPEDEHSQLDARGHDSAQWVIGFHHARAAQLDRLEWQAAVDSSGESASSRLVTVEASLGGAAGPWHELAQWQVSTSPGENNVLALPDMPWARYLRFTVPLEEGETRFLPPGQVRVIEREAGNDYLSIVGEWDGYRRDSHFELIQGSGEIAPSLSQDLGNDDIASAHAFAAGERFDGSVEVAVDEDWFRLTVPQGHSELVVTLEGDPGIAYLYELYDAGGEPLLYEEQVSGEEVTLTAYAQPGDYYLHLYEPRRSVVFSWDTSGSVAPYQPITYSSLASFSAGLDPHREVTQLLAFDDPQPRWLLSHWSDDPLKVQTTINTFDRQAHSSNAETALLTASEGLADREGTRAVLFMTDAETYSYGDTAALWESLQAVRPRIFTFEISSGGSDWTQDLMQDWAAVNGGHYDYARSIGDFDVGFRRASCHLRRPKGFTLAYSTNYREPPGPGMLTVERSGESVMPAVQVIFDASGSMGSRLESGESRIDAARSVLTQLVNEILPEEVPFALRAFGHVLPNSCEMSLEIPLAPLDRAAAQSAISAIEPKLLSQTPIADALLAVPGDLGGAASGSTVILITDGEESCGGDPVAAVEELRAQGLDVRLSIVSLGIEEEAVQDRFADLASSAGGEYVDVQDRDALRASVEEALHPTFTVLDSGGERIATGKVGAAPVELPMGIYEVKVEGVPGLHPVRVPGDGSVSLRVDVP